MVGKRVCTAALCAMLICTTLLAAGCSDKDEPTAKGTAQEWSQLVDEADDLAAMGEDLAESEELEYFVRQAVLLQQMKEFFDRNTPYPAVRIIAACKIAAGDTEEEAFEQAEDAAVREPAALWYAEKHGIEVSDDRLARWIEEYNAFKDQVLYESVCKEVGISAEVFNRYMQRQYRMLCIMDLANKTDEKVNEEAIVAEYKESSEYKTLKRLMESCEELYRSGGDSDLEKVLAADIWY